MECHTIAHTTPAPYRLGTHPRRPDHRALLAADGTLQSTFGITDTRAEIAATLARGGLTLHEDDTVTQAADTAPTRRGILSGLALAGAGLLVAASARAADHPDAALLAACARFDALELQIWPPEGRGCMTIAEEDAWAARVQPLEDEQAALLGEVCALRAQTLEGVQARARSLLLWSSDIADDIESGDGDHLYWDHRMVAALVRDLAGGQAA